MQCNKSLIQGELGPVSFVFAETSMWRPLGDQTFQDFTLYQATVESASKLNCCTIYRDNNWHLNVTFIRKGSSKPRQSLKCRNILWCMLHDLLHSVVRPFCSGNLHGNRNPHILISKECLFIPLLRFWRRVFGMPSFLLFYNGGHT